MNKDEQNRKTQGQEVCPGKKDKLELVELRAEVENKNSPEMWRSLEELAGSAEVRDVMHREFPRGASEWIDSVSRRGFLKLMGSSLALAGMTACTRQPLEPIVPYVRQPEGLVPGKAMSYATAFALGGYASPLLVTSREFRPIKVEGNPQHQASLGGTDVFAQASVLDLYDPDRSQNVLYLGEISTWSTFVGVIRGPLNSQKAVAGAGIRVLSQAFSSPTLADQMQQFQKNFPQAKWHVYEPVNRDNVYAGAQMAFGQPLETVYKLDAADVIVSLDGDFLYGGFPGMTRYARDFARRRDPDSGKMSRFYAVESTPTATGAKADHRLSVRASEVEALARDLLEFVVAGGKVSGGDRAPELRDRQTFVQAAGADLAGHKRSSLVVVGDHQPPAVHALAHALNEKLGNVGQTVFYTDPVLATTASQNDSVRDLVADVRAGKVDLLVILGGNPVFDAPADLGFADALKNSNIPLRVHLGLHHNETAELCHWHVSETHYLEQWSDGRAYDGTVTIVQPLIAPLYAGKSAHELVSLLNGQAETPGHELVQNYWKSKHAGADFDSFWRKSLHDGWVEGTTLAPKSVSLKTASFPPAAGGIAQDAFEINFRRDPSIYDGRFANNAWLQELPRPLTKMTWDNPLLMSPRTAERLKVQSQDMVRVDLNGTSLELPVWIQAGHPERAVTLYLGYGRRRSGRAGNGTGFDVYPLRYSATPWTAVGGVAKSGGTYVLASTQGYQTMDVGDQNRPIVRTTTLEEFRKSGAVPEEEPAPKPEETLYPAYDYASQPYAWGMAIDHNACVGCNNCIVACQAENNIPVVGKEQVNRGRHMHWLRIDVYYQGDRDNPKAYFQPVPCMQCENAPCEIVCPVGATSHSTEGLNDMIYNRCVGTRYCSNNCPYKVRRFNFLLFQDWDTPQLKMQRNPDVSVRSRGVMEKCTYCVQRITHARIKAEEENRKIADNEFQTACQQSCPANAIVFGNINDANSLVSRWKAKSRNYATLDDLNTRPRTTYLAAIRNPNPELESGS
jgi:molybdopterin-containing oxidoreductase family iron-sulfur binding subunit